MKVVPSNTSTIHRKERYVDLSFLQKALEEIHSNLYSNVDRETFTRALYRTVDLDSSQFQFGIQEALSLLGDAHTSVPAVMDVLGQELPIRIKEFEGKYHIVGADSVNKRLLFKEINRINSYELPTITEKLSALSSQENSEKLIRDYEWLLRSCDALKYYGLANTDDFEIRTSDGVFLLKAGSKRVPIIHPLDWDEGKADYFGNSEFYRYKIQGNTIIFQYKECENDGFSDSYLDEFKNSLLNELNSISNIVVDLRLNSGGDDEIMESLFQQIPSSTKVFVAMGRVTYSSAMKHVLDLQKYNNATLIGENAGQKPNRFGDTKEIILPNSGLLIHCSFQYFEYLPGTDIAVVKPDIYIPVTIDDYKNNTDPLLSWINHELNNT